MKKTSYIEIKEFREKGYLLEVNRLFLHPLGLALTIKVDDEGVETILGIADFRDDPEGILFADSIINDVEMSELSKLVEKDKMREVQEFNIIKGRNKLKAMLDVVTDFNK